MLRGVGRAGLFIGVGAAAGCLLLVYGFARLTSAKAEASSQPPVMRRLQVVATARPVAQGERLAPADVAVSTPSGGEPAGALTSAGEAVGRIAASDLPGGRVLTGADLVGDASVSGLAALVPVGYRAISLETSDEIAVSSLLRPGDLVDVQLVLKGPVAAGLSEAGPLTSHSESATLLQAVRVVSVGDIMGAPSQPGGPASAGRSPGQPVRRTMTLAMTPEQVALFTLARSVGSFYLALRNPTDRATGPRAFARLPDITDSRPPVAVVRTPARIAAATAPGSVELVVGDERRLIYPQPAQPQ